MVRFLFSALLAIMSLMPTMAKAAYTTAIGAIVEVEGEVMRRTPNGERSRLEYESPVFLHDTIETAKGGRAMILFDDETQLVLSENAHLRVDKYVYNPGNNADNAAEYSVLQGAFNYVSGLIAKNPTPDVTVNTAYGSIGIRGTEFWGGDIDGQYGVLVSDGEVRIKNSGGEATVRKGEGSMIFGRRMAPNAATVWKKEKIAKARKTIAFRNQTRANARKAAMIERLQERFGGKGKGLNKDAIIEKLQDQKEKLQELQPQFKPGEKAEIRRERKTRRRFQQNP